MLVTCVSIFSIASPNLRISLAQSSPQQPTYLCVTEVVEHIAGRRIHDATSTTSSCGTSSTSDSVCWSRFFWDTGIHVFIWFSCYSSCLSLVIISTCTYVLFFFVTMFLVFGLSNFQCFCSFFVSEFLSSPPSWESVFVIRCPKPCTKQQEEVVSN